MSLHCLCRRADCVECRNRKIRKDAVRIALRVGGTVPWSIETMMDDGWSVTTIRKVLR